MRSSSCDRECKVSCTGNIRRSAMSARLICNKIYSCIDCVRWCGCLFKQEGFFLYMVVCGGD